MMLSAIVAAIITVFVLVVGGLMTTVGPWYRGINKPSWNPPDWIFGPAWTVRMNPPFGSAQDMNLRRP